MNLLAAIGLFFFVNYALNAQQTASTPEASKTFDSCDRESNSVKRLEDIKILPLVHDDMFNRADLTFVHPDLKGTQIFSIDEGTAMPNEISKTYRKRFWWIVYSTFDNYIDLISEPAQRQLYGAKKN